MTNRIYNDFSSSVPNDHSLFYIFKSCQLNFFFARDQMQHNDTFVEPCYRYHGIFINEIWMV